MYYRMTRLHWDEDRYDDLVAWAANVEQRVEAIDGLLFAGLVRSGPDNGMLIAAYESETAATNAGRSQLMAELTAFLNRPPHGHEGTVVQSYGSV